MNYHKDSFTDPSQLDKLNQSVWKRIENDHGMVESVKSEVEGTLLASQDTGFVESGSSATETPPSTE
jgi:hypothetical protein